MIENIGAFCSLVFFFFVSFRYCGDHSQDSVSTDKILDRGEKISILVDKTSELEATSVAFQSESSRLFSIYMRACVSLSLSPTLLALFLFVVRPVLTCFPAGATKLKRKLWWQNLKLWIIIGILVAVRSHFPPSNSTHATRTLPASDLLRSLSGSSSRASAVSPSPSARNQQLGTRTRAV